MSYDNMIKLIRPRTDEESILIWIDIPAINGGFVRGLLDSATTECIIQSEVVEQNKFLNTILYLKIIKKNSFYRNISLDK